MYAVEIIVDYTGVDDLKWFNGTLIIYIIFFQ